MAKEYIEREAICENCNNKDSCFPYPEMRAKCPVYKTPAADVEPVVHGEWIPIVSYFHGKPDGRYYCSVCHRVETMKGIYCRLCGARMDEATPFEEIKTGLQQAINYEKDIANGGNSDA